MKNNLIAVLILSGLGVSTLVSVPKNPLRPIKAAIGECDLTKVKSEYKKLEHDSVSTDELKKHLDELIKAAQDVVDSPPMISSPNAFSGTRVAKQLGGTVLLGCGILGVIGSVSLYSDRKDPIKWAYRVLENPDLRGYTSGGIAAMGTAFAGLTALGTLLLWSAHKQGVPVSGLEQAKAIESYLENELNYLNDSQEEA